ncbi:general substrate transporter [Teratosphaeria destructans]|uniref:General substrate transporter n=1 Tax=Teratosphaeria destructans TaxID=418781 RepID=A0A9W7SN45_9PEZI|nr:general substrate transporter [Teratosphaeria destructans]
METFALAAQHSGAISHLHTFSVTDSAITVAKEVRNIVSLVVVGWITVAAIGAVRDSLKKER